MYELLEKDCDLIHLISCRLCSKAFSFKPPEANCSTSALKKFTCADCITINCLRSDGTKNPKHEKVKNNKNNNGNSNSNNNNNKHSLKRHKKAVHTEPPKMHQCPKGSKTHKCPSCPYSAAWHYSLRQHILAKHTELTRDFKCTECEKSFYNKSELSQHGFYCAKNPGRRESKCDICGGFYPNIGLLKKHMKSHVRIII